MNDFTKEELESILDQYSSPNPTALWSPIVDKILSMIDNYCDHEFKKTLDKSGMCFIAMCHKCDTQKPWGEHE